VTENNNSIASDILERVSDIGIKQISLSTNDASLSELLKSAREKVAALHLELVWNLPVPYSAMHPVAMEAVDAEIEGAGRAWLYVEPDGDVLPAQGSTQVLGNLLRDPWEKIWKGIA
jgi:MoaA/NifB/PqqE/SkfB family radical SAM enzyme